MFESSRQSLMFYSGERACSYHFLRPPPLFPSPGYPVIDICVVSLLPPDQMFTFHPIPSHISHPVIIVCILFSTSGRTRRPERTRRGRPSRRRSGTGATVSGLMGSSRQLPSLPHDRSGERSAGVARGSTGTVDDLCSVFPCSILRHHAL